MTSKTDILRRGEMNDDKLRWNMPADTPARQEGSPGEIMGSSCGKDLYPSQEAAEAAIKLIPKKSRARMAAWECKTCNCWHIGHWIKK